MNGAWAAGNVIGPAATGAVAQVTSDAVPWLVCAGLCVATLAALQLLRARGGGRRCAGRRRRTAVAAPRPGAGTVVDSLPHHHKELSMSDIKIAVGDRFPLEKIGATGPAVVYVYPKDSTSGCELESRGFNALYDEFKGLGVDVFGVSAGDDSTAAQFSSECGLSFKLVPSPEVTEELGLLKDFGQYGILPRRITFLVGADGTVQKIWDVEDIQSHPGEVLAAAKSL